MDMHAEGMDMHGGVEGVDSKGRGRLRGRLAVGRLLLGAAVFAALSAAGSAGALAATPDTPYDTLRVGTPTPQATPAWGFRAASARDLNDDRVNDFFVSAYSETITGAREGGRVYLLSGRDRSVVRTFEPPTGDRRNDLYFGFFISVPGDLTGDGKDDLAVGSDPADPAAPQRVWIYNGATGAFIERIENPATPQTNTRFGARIGRAGDVSKPGADGAAVSGKDGVPDLIVGDSAYNYEEVRDQGRAYIFDGATRKLFRTLDVPAADRSSCKEKVCSFGAAVQGPGDVDKDGVEDQLVGAHGQESQGRMYVFSGQTGDLIRAIDAPQRELFGAFGFQDAAPLSPGDVNGDGFADVYGNGFDHDGPAGSGQGRAWVFSGQEIAKGGTPLSTSLRTLDDPTPSAGGQFGWSMAKTDYNHDGTPDLYVGQAPHHQRGDQDGGTYVLDGKDGSLLKALELPPCDEQNDDGVGFGPNLGWGLAAPGDLNGDGEDDYVGGAPYYDVGTSGDQGRVYVFQSSDTAKPPPPPPGNSDGVTCKPRPGGGHEITGTPGNDTIVGTNKDDVIVAGDGSDTIVGGAGNDVIVAGDGNDVVAAGAGDDYVDSGAGNDYISGGDGNDRASGGTGSDRIRGDSGNDTIAGDDGDDTLLGDSGNDRLYGGAGNDYISGGAGDDYVNSGSGNDRISGGDGNDRASGGTGADRIVGDRGNDTLSGNDGDDTLLGGDGSDRLYGGAGNDYLSGGDGNDTLVGGGGTDRLSGGSGRNVVRQ
jgi:Ca2+-binding RTX toxin-like protein